MAKIKNIPEAEGGAIATPEVNMVKFKVVGSVSSTIEVNGTEVRLFNGAEIELPEGCKEIDQLLIQKMIEPVEPAVTTENTEEV